MANSSSPLFEVESEIVTYVPTSTSLSFPDPIPDQPGTIAYATIPIPLDPQPLVGITSRLFSVLCSVSAAAVGNGKGVLTFRIGQAAPSLNDFNYEIPMSSLISSDIASPFLISFTGLVKSLAGQIPRLYISKVATTDTTTYNVEYVRINSKSL
jgi:hypothetical protein